MGLASIYCLKSWWVMSRLHLARPPGVWRGQLLRDAPRLQRQALPGVHCTLCNLPLVTRGDLLKSVPWSKSDIFLFFWPYAAQIVFFVGVSTPQWTKSGGASLFFLVGPEIWVFQYWCHTLTQGFLGHKVAYINQRSILRPPISGIW